MPDRIRLLLVGATGRLGATLAACYGERYELITPDRSQLDLNRPDTLAASLESVDFDLAINAAAMTNLEACEADPERALRVNALAAEALADECSRRCLRFIHFSTDYVFAGEGCTFLDENAPARPLSIYGRTKRQGEESVLAACQDALVARVSWLFGPQGGDVPEAVLKRVRQGESLGFIEDKWSVPTSTLDIAHWTERLLTDLSSVTGLLHLGNTGTATWRDYAQFTLDLAWRHGLLDESHSTVGLRLRDFPQFVAHRPPFTTLSNQRLAFLLQESPRSWQSALEEHIVSLAQRSRP